MCFESDLPLRLPPDVLFIKVPFVTIWPVLSNQNPSLLQRFAHIGSVPLLLFLFFPPSYLSSVAVCRPSLFLLASVTNASWPTHSNVLKARRIACVSKTFVNLPRSYFLLLLFFFSHLSVPTILTQTEFHLMCHYTNLICDVGHINTTYSVMT